MIRFLTCFLLIVGVISCKSVKNTSDNSDYIVFTFRKTPCRGVCPVYYMEIYKSGKATFEGEKNVDKIGRYETQLEKLALENLILDFKKVKFSDFNNEYLSPITDLPTTYISYNNGFETKTIRDYYGSPDELKELEEKLEAIALSNHWTIRK